MENILHEFWYNFTHNLFKPLLLFFYLGFLVPIFRVPFEFPHVIYQGLTIYLLVSIGWHGGVELAALDGRTFAQAGGLMVIGFMTNFIIGCVAYQILRRTTKMRQVDAATVGGYYGSDSAGTFVTCVGVLGTLAITYQAYMPVMLAVMEIPGCLVALFLVSRLRGRGMDPLGNMPGEPGYDADHESVPQIGSLHGDGEQPSHLLEEAEESAFNGKVLREVFLNPGLYLLFGGIIIGYISRLQGEKVIAEGDRLFVQLFQGALCLFLLEMGMTASKRLRDLKTAGWRFIVFGLVAPNLFATAGIFVAHGYNLSVGAQFSLGTYVLFAVLCGAASYIAVPAVQGLAIPEASPTLPLAASLGLTFSYNVTIGIPVYIEIAKVIMKLGVGSVA